MIVAQVLIVVSALVAALVVVALAGVAAEWIDRRDHRRATERKREREEVNHHAPITEARRHRAG